MAALFEAHVANLGKYNEGVLAGEPLSFPASPQAVQALLKEIGVDGIRYETIFIASYDFGGILPELSGCLSGYENLDCFEFYPDIENEEDLGRYFTEDLAIPAELKGYIDFEAYGRDLSINEGGHFSHGGYIVQTGPLKEIYHGIEDIPREHKVFSYPQLNIREQMAAYKEVIDRSSLEAERKHPETGREGR